MKKETQRIGKRKKAAVLVCAIIASVFMTACGSKDKEYLKDITASDYVTLGNYIGIEASAEEPVVDDGKVDAYYAHYLQRIPIDAVMERPIEEGDTVNIDFVGYLDGEAFEGGTGSDYDLKIGSHRFIDGFEDGLIGVNYGETVSLDLTFPDPYSHNPDLSGVPVVFVVTVNGRKDIDGYVQSLGIEGCSTEQDFMNYLYNALYDDAVQTYNDTIESTLTNTIMADCTFKEPPAKMVERYAQAIEETSAAQAAVYGMTLADYMGTDAATYKEQFKTWAFTQVQQYIMYQAIADIEGLNVTDEQLKEEIAGRVEAYGYESEEAYRESNDVETLREWIMGRNVLEFLKENGDITMIPVTGVED